MHGEQISQGTSYRVARETASQIYEYYKKQNYALQIWIQNIEMSRIRIIVHLKHKFF